MSEPLKVDEHAKSNILLVHHFKDVIPDIDEFCKADSPTGVIQTVNSFCNRVKALATKYKDQIDENNFKGWSLELLTEYLIKTNGSDNRIGIWDYVPVRENDTGVDGTGHGENQNPAAVQVKFRAGDVIMTGNEDHLTNFALAAYMKYGVKMEDDKNLLIVHTAMKIADFTMSEMLLGKVRELNREALREMLDHRPEWWIRFWEAIKASRTTKSIIPIKPLRLHQQEAVRAMFLDKDQCGKIILPTGCGKTLIQIEYAHEIIKLEKAICKNSLIQVNSPRILLCFQHFAEFRQQMLAHGVDALYLNFNSGNAEDRAFATEIRKMGGAFRDIISTTSVQEAKEAYERAQKANIPLICFVTYHSAVKFANIGVVPSLVMHDEAHRTVSEAFADVQKLAAERKFSFTATEITTDDDMGMNNEGVFGNLVYSRSAKEMIALGEMVGPYMHLVMAKDGVVVDLEKLDKDYEALLHSIVDAYFAHKKKVREVSADPSKIGAKMLVVCRGQQDLMEMFDSKVFQTLSKDYPNIKIYALSSEFGIYAHGRRDHAPVTASKKLKLLHELRSLPMEDDAIIFHVDMIGEGIDIAGITGVMPFRNCELPKFVQNIGRAARLHPIDRARLYACKTPEEAQAFINNKKLWIKPWSWVVIPQFILSAEGFDKRAMEITEKLRSEFGWIPSEHKVIDNPNGLDDDEDIDTVNDKQKNRPHANSGMDAFEHKFEDENPFSIFDLIEDDNEFGERKAKVVSELNSLIALPETGDSESFEFTE